MKLLLGKKVSFNFFEYHFLHFGWNLTPNMEIFATFIAMKFLARWMTTLLTTGLMENDVSVYPTKQWWNDTTTSCGENIEPTRGKILICLWNISHIIRPNLNLIMKYESYYMTPFKKLIQIWTIWLSLRKTEHVGRKWTKAWHWKAKKSTKAS